MSGYTSNTSAWYELYEFLICLVHVVVVGACSFIGGWLLELFLL